MQILKADKLSKFYGLRINTVHALDNISLAIDEGEFVGIMGPSGAGKTTLLNLLSTIDQPTTGQVSIGGVAITHLPEAELAKFRRHQLGFIFQDFNLLSSLTVRENIVLPLALERQSLATIETQLLKVAQILGIYELLERYPEELSIGQQQRVASGRAMITEPEILFADEPTGSLDSKSATELLHYLTEINLQEGKTIVMVTHDAFTASYSNRIIFIKDGKFFAEFVRHGSRRDFFEQIMDMQATIGGGGKLNAREFGL